MITRILLIARNAFRAIMSRRALYIWAAAILLMFMRAVPALFFGGDWSRMLFVRAAAVAGGLETWALLCLAAAILLGAGAAAGEITSKTVVTMLARPVERWEILAGKWLGVLAFVGLSLAIGVALATGLAAYLGVDVDERILVAAVAQTMIACALFSGVAVVLGSAGSMALAIAVTLLLAYLPLAVVELKRAPENYARTRLAGRVLDYVAPPGYDDLYQGVTWAPFPRSTNPRARMPPDRPRAVVSYREQGKLLGANVAYAGVYFLLGCWVWTRRDVSLA